MDRRLVPPLVILIAGSIAFTLAAWFSGIFSFDLEAARLLRGFNSPLFISAMKTVSFPGDGWVPAVLVVVVATLCLVKKKWPEALVVAATLSAVFLAGTIKVLVSRPRPPTFTLHLYDVVQPASQYSYPSGHVLFFVVFFGFVAYLSSRYLSGCARRSAIAACTMFILLIGPSRIILGAHWASDVVGSYLIGASCLVSLVLIYQEILQRETNEPEHS